jgi:hypothetical protein
VAEADFRFWHKANATIVGEMSAFAGKADSASHNLDVRYWHKADMAMPLSDVRFWGQSGHWTE